MRNSKITNPGGENSGKGLKKWETPALYQEDINATKGASPLGPAENAFYHT